ncbi:anaphase-promoting complex subunit 15 [Bicyclus anynana]|uniref:Anaphase-promoting complex subunit 15 n=1 Tax=Bicyclus anynana TaxID=110368 RepID=A0A6J1MYW0_BICAN|nr:anaphase-promoting complex subunit 15 [Bicyclus anynana]
MNIPFPVIYPPIIAPDWFNPDRPCDEDAELTLLEQANEQWFNSIAQKYMKHAPVIKKAPAATNEPPADDTGSDDDVFIVTTNDDADESTSRDMDEESADMDEDEEITTTESPEINNEDESDSPDDIAEVAVLEVQASMHGNQGNNE